MAQVSRERIAPAVSMYECCLGIRDFHSSPASMIDIVGIIKAGFAGGDRPKIVFSSAVGRPKHVRMMPGGALEGSDV